MRGIPVPELVVGIDPEIDPLGRTTRAEAERKLLEYARALRGYEVVVKVEATLRFLGYGLVDMLHAEGLRVFADAKLSGNKEKLVDHGAHLAEVAPEVLTVMAAVPADGLRVLKQVLPDTTEVLAVTVLTGLLDEECHLVYGHSTNEVVSRLTGYALRAGVDGVVCAPAEVEMLRAKHGRRFSISVAGVRPMWALVRGDDQNRARATTLAEAVRARVTRVIMERPFLQADNFQEAVDRALEEMSEAARPAF